MKVKISDSIIANNRFAGLGINGPAAVLRMSSCNVFHHPLQGSRRKKSFVGPERKIGIEVLSDVPLANVTIENCHCHNNLNGILRWIPPDLDLNAVSRTLESTK